MLDLLSPLYSVDVVCDPHVASSYERLGVQRLTGTARRNRQAAVLRIEVQGTEGSAHSRRRGQDADPLLRGPARRHVSRPWD